MITTLFAGSLLFSCSSVYGECESSPHVYNGGRVLFVSPEGKGNGNGSCSSPFSSIQAALNEAEPGDTVVLLPGVYRENFHTVRDGLPCKPITVVGTPGALILGNTSHGGKVVLVKNSYVTLMKLNINGRFCSANTEKCYHNKLIYVEGSPDRYLKGVRILSVNVANALGECIRLKYVRDSEVAWSSVSHCGLKGFYFHEPTKNGEGIYVGTSINQVKKGQIDESRNIRIHHNVIATYGSECIDVKEGSSHIYIYDNVCMANRQSTSAGISIRGNENTVSHNIVFDSSGAGIRIGSAASGFAEQNSVIYNVLICNRTAALKIFNTKQKEICSNTADKKKVIPGGSPYRERGFEPCTGVTRH